VPQQRPGCMDAKPAYSCLQRNTATADLDVPTLTKNVKVGQPPTALSFFCAVSLPPLSG